MVPFGESVHTFSDFICRATRQIPPPLLASPAATTTTTKALKKAHVAAGETPIRSSGRLAAKPTSGLSALDKAKLVLLKKSGVVAENDAPVVGDLQRYRAIYNRTLPPFFISAVTALVDAVSPRKRKDDVPLAPVVTAV